MAASDARSAGDDHEVHGLIELESDAYPALQCAEYDSRGNPKCKRRLQVDPVTGLLMKIDQEETL